MYERLFHRQGPCGRQGSPEVTANMGMFPATIQICHVSLTTRRNGRPPGRCSHVLLASDIVSTHLVGPNRAAVRPEEVGYSCAILVHDEAHSRCVDASSGLTSPRDPHHRFATRATCDPAKPAPDRAGITVDPCQPPGVARATFGARARPWRGVHRSSGCQPAACQNPGQPRSDLSRGQISAYMYMTIGHSCIRVGGHSTCATVSLAHTVSWGLRALP